jgi:ornithine carbamoyltransferase
MDDLSPAELLALLDLSDRLKARRQAGTPGDSLRGKSVALVFEKQSTRTRCAFLVAASDEGAHAEYLGLHDIHLGKKESIADTARVLGRMFHGIAFRGYRQSTIEQLAKHAGIPLWNALTDEWHPTQILADLMTVRERFGELAGLRLVYVGDGRNNVANTLMYGCAMAGVHFVNCTPRELSPDAAHVRAASALAARQGATVALAHDPREGVRGANVVYTDVWVSMGEEAQFQERLQLLRPFQVDMAMMERTGQLAADRVMFLHCLPAFHDSNTTVTRDTGPLEVTDDVFEAPFSKVFDQAENRIHTIKAVMVGTLT